MRKLQVGDAGSLNRARRKLLNGSEEIRYLHRLNAVDLVAKGCSCYQVARWFGEAPRTVERWVDWYRRFGCTGLRGNQNIGRPSKLSKSDLAEVKLQLARNPAELGYSGKRWTGSELAIYIRECFKVELSERQCQRLIRQSRASVEMISGTTSEA